MVMTMSYGAAEVASEPVSVAQSFIKSLSLLEQAHRRLHEIALEFSPIAVFTRSPELILDLVARLDLPLHANAEAGELGRRLDGLA